VGSKACARVARQAGAEIAAAESTIAVVSSRSTGIGTAPPAAASVSASTKT
jgi:hypothetical protein